MAFLVLQVIQEVSGLPSEGASEGNQYAPDAQRLNCQKVSLCAAWERVQFSLFSVKIKSIKLRSLLLPVSPVSKTCTVPVASGWQENR